MGLFVAGEGRRSYGRTTTASMAHRTVLTVRQPLGVAALIMSFNTPLPNVAWKAFPAMFCGNAAVVKPSEHTPASASFFARARAGGRRSRQACSTSSTGSAPRPARRSSSTPDVDLVSFTGSAATGRVDQRGGGAAAREDVPRARREERARRLRRRGSRQRGPLGARIGVLERRAALCVGEPDRRASTRVYDAFRDAARRGGDGARAAAGHQPRVAGADSRGGRASARDDGRDRPRRGRAARAAGLVPRPDRRRGRGSGRRDLAHGALRAGDGALPRRATSTRRSRSSTTRRTASRRRSTPRASTARCASPSRCRPASSS